MDNNKMYNIMIVGVSCFDGMASSTRVRNLIEPLINGNLINVNNLIYEKDAEGLNQKNGLLNHINYQVIGFRKANPFSLFSFIRDGLKFIKKNKSLTQKNIIYGYGQPDLKNILFLIYAKLKGYKIILDIVEDNRYHSAFKGQRILTRINTMSSVFFIKRSHYIADTFLTISNHLYDLMIALSKRKIPVYHIPITVDINKFDKKKYHIPDRFKIFYGGSFGVKDGLEYLIKAFEKISLKFNNVDLFLTGRGTESAINHINRLICNSSVKERIFLKGYLNPKDYYVLINECDIFCMTRINSMAANTGFPFKLGEFLATSKAVIATNVGDVSNYLSNNKNALVIKPCSVEELVNALLLILENPEKIISLGIEGRKTAERYFDSEKVSMSLYDIFQTL